MNFATDAIGIILKEIQKKEKYVCMTVALRYYLKVVPLLADFILCLFSYPFMQLK